MSIIRKVIEKKYSPIILLLVEVLVVVTLILVIFKPAFFAKNNPFKTTSITYYQAPQYKKEMVDGKIKEALKEKDPKKALSIFVGVFRSIRIDYLLRPTNEKRESMLLIKKHVAEKYNKESKEITMDVPCLEESCGAKFSSDKELMALKAGIEASSLSADLKDVIGVGIRRAQVSFGANDKKMKYNDIYGIYSNLKNARTEKNSQEINLLLANSQSMLKQIDSEKYALFDRYGSFK